MARLSRIVVPGVPHHVIQRGNRRQRTFFRTSDFKTYLTLLSRFSRQYGVEIWAWVLMPNHTHLIATPHTESALARAIGRTHEAYTRIINRRHDWRGYLWQGRFKSFPMDEPYLITAARYVLLNPVRAGLSASALDWRWSSARAHVSHRPDGLTKLSPLAERVEDWTQFLRGPISPAQREALRRHSSTGRPLGDEAFLERLERLTGRRLVPGKAGRPKK